MSGQHQKALCKGAVVWISLMIPHLAGVKVAPNQSLVLLGTLVSLLPLCSLTGSPS